jgi:RNA polymerase sigma factor (sigma-70 family)
MARREARMDELESIYREGLPQLVRAASAIAGDDSTGRDAVQDAFAHAVRARRSFRGDVPLEAWVWRIVVNAAIDARRRRLRDEPVEDVEANTGTAPDGDAAVRAWIAALPERQRLVVFLRYFADLDYRAIASALEIETGTVSATLSAAHTALRRALQQEVHR